MSLTTPYGDDLLDVLAAATVRTGAYCCTALAISLFFGGFVAAASRSSKSPILHAAAVLLEAMGPMLPAIAILSSLGIRSEFTIAVLLGLLTWNTSALFLEEEFDRLSKCGFVEAARTMGASSGRILIRHIVPSILPRLLPLSFALFASYAGLFGALGFLGVASNAQNSLGFMIFDAKSYYGQNPSYFWGSVLAFMFLMMMPTSVLKLARTIRRK